MLFYVLITVFVAKVDFAFVMLLECMDPYLHEQTGQTAKRE